MSREPSPLKKAERKLPALMDELREVLRRHGAELSSCGCCGGIHVEIGGLHVDENENIKP